MSDIRDDYLKFRVDDEDRSKDNIMSSAIKILVIILLVLLLIVLGAVAYKFLFKDEKTAQTQPVRTQPVQAQPQNQENSNIVQNVTQAVENKSGGVKKEEIALIVKSVLAQMNQNKPQPTQTTQQKQIEQPTEVKSEVPQNNIEQSTDIQANIPQNGSEGEDAMLLSDLSSADVDSVKEEDLDLSALDNIDSNKQVQNNKKKADTFNKVIIDKNEVATKDDLSKLYEKLNQIMKKDKTKVTSSNYVSKIKKETKVRSNEMRIIRVRKGDTLSLIAKRAYGNPMLYSKIFAANPDLIKNPNRIYPGQRLRVPK